MLFGALLASIIVGATYFVLNYVKLAFFYNYISGLKQKVVEFDYADFWYKTKFLCRYMWPNDTTIRVKTIVCVIIMIAGNILNMAVPLLGKLMVDKLSSEQHFASDVLTMTFGFLCLQGNAYINQALSDARQMIYVSVQHYTEARVRVEIYNHIMHLPYTWYSKKGGHDINNVFHQSASTFLYFPDYLIFSLLPGIVDAFVATAFFASTFDWYLTIMVSSVALVYFVSIKVMDNWSNKAWELMDDEVDAFDSYAMTAEALENYETVKYFCNEDLEVENYKKRILRQHAIQLRQEKSSHINMTVRSIVTDCLLMMGTFLMAYRKTTESSDLTAGDYVLFTNYFYKFTGPMWTLDGAYGQITRSLTDAAPLIELLDTPVEGEDGLIKDAVISGGLKMDKVCYSYVEGTEVLHNISFEVPEGKTVALVGPTGSGKSTIIKMLYRFLKPTDGAILINDVNINDYNVYDYRKWIGVVPQDCVLFNNSIKYNLNYAKRDADEKDIERATRAAQIEEMIEKKPEKLETKVGERGGSLSGGEKQRMAIARTILKDPKYLFMDEATSSLDSITEREIQKALTDLAKNKTCIIVAHRLSTIVHADNIVVLKNGRVLEQGSHKQLLETNGLYKEMWTLQQGGNFDQ